ncbi:MAG TPA: cardiolipin synthase [Sphingomonadaceae bacterium]|nr:cardiolipin synthase [Sphingomonadaceae bacterium]
MPYAESHLGTLFYVIEWLIRLGAVGVVPLRRPPAAARAWLLMIFFLPVPGLLLFLAIGSPRFPQWRTERFHRLRPFFAALSERLAIAAPPSEKEAPIAAFAERLGYLPATHGNRIELIDDYDAVIARLIADIDTARHHVHLLVYIFADDAVGRAVIAALERAVRRGVACHVMIDPVGSLRWMRAVRQRLQEAGVELVEALPFTLWRRRTRRDMRNHRKLFVIDGRVGFAGSQNIIARDFRPGVVNRELVCRVEGPVVAEMAGVVRADWCLETDHLPGGEPDIPPPVGDASAQLLPSGPDYPLEGFETLLTWQLHQARERVVIATPYFIPDEDVLGAMRTAAARDVTIDLILSATVDQHLVNLAQRSYYDDLLRAGVRVHLYRDYLLHAKNVSIDGALAIVGSSNVDLRSFQLNAEVSLLLFDAGSVAAVEAVQHGYLAHSDTLSLAAWRRRPLPIRLLENIARLMGSLF